jgi:hypothetical protein
MGSVIDITALDMFIHVTIRVPEITVTRAKIELYLRKEQLHAGREDVICIAE